MTEETRDPATSRWHVDRRINISLILTLAILFVGQTSVMSRWVGAIEQRVAQLEESEERSANQSALLARLEEQLSNTVSSLGRIELRLETLIDKRDDSQHSRH